MNHRKAERKIRLENGWTKASHKGLKIYYKFKRDFKKFKKDMGIVG